MVLDRDAGALNAALTALIGAVVWAATSYAVGWVPLVGLVAPAAVGIPGS